MTLPQAPHFPDRDFDLLKYGGVADGQTLNTTAFARAIDACARAGGGRVIVPPGNWLTGAIHLQSNVDLDLAEGATIRFSADPKDYLPVVPVRWSGFEIMNYSPLIYAQDCENIAITGRGTIDGQGKPWWTWAKQLEKTSPRLHQMAVDNVPVSQRIFGTPEDALRPQLIEPIRCKNVLVEGVTILSGPFWTVQFVYCDQVIARNLTIRTVGPNNDGICFDSSRNGLIEDCDISTGDDCITMKSGLNEDGLRVNRPTENVVVRRCTTRAGHGGFVVGSETSGGVRNILVDDCHFLGTDRGIRLKSARGRGNVVESIWCRNIQMTDIRDEAIQISTFYKAWFGGESGPDPTFRNIHIQDVTVSGAKTGISIAGLPEQPIENVTMQNLQITAVKGMEGSDIQGLTLDHVNIEPTTGPDVMVLTDSRNVVISHSAAPAGCDTFLRVSGAKSSGIQLLDDNVASAKTPFQADAGVPAGAVQVQN